MAILRDMTNKGGKRGGEINYIRICNQCDPSMYPTGKPILPDEMAKKNDKGEWVCSECQTEDINRMMLRTLGPNHPKCQAFIKTEEREVRRRNDAARRLNEKAGQHIMGYKRNRYTDSMPLTPY